jgi:hypothetical protein
MIKKTLISTIIASSLLLQGCISFNSLADAKNARGTGVSKQYSATKAQVWQQTLGVIEKSDLNLVNEDFSKGLILAQQPIAPLSLTAGQNVAVFVSKSGQQTRVEVVAKKAVGTIEFTSRDWEGYIIEQLDERIK